MKQVMMLTWNLFFLSNDTINEIVFTNWFQVHCCQKMFIAEFQKVVVRTIILYIHNILLCGAVSLISFFLMSSCWRSSISCSRLLWILSLPPRWFWWQCNNILLLPSFSSDLCCFLHDRIFNDLRYVLMRIIHSWMILIVLTESLKVVAKDFSLCSFFSLYCV